MSKKIQSERLIDAWIQLSGMLKKTKMTQGLAYNEATVMRLLYQRFCEDGKGIISIKEITEKTKMLKSLVNRTLKSLEYKGLLKRCDVKGDKRLAYVSCVAEKLEIFLDVHEASLKMAGYIIEIIGKEDAEAFIRIVKKIENAGYSPA